ncbi:MAG: UDP-N-acetylmuramoyl-tripeptide--D-alanyl-D-alanine ligase [Promicromonosporaceae bacterium]|nr:UDP-N-acetylmuramoyl-tripeptide--D-alanyl-D-alanine ligase [Promicromonosporaceae bacterium]
MIALTAGQIAEMTDGSLHAIDPERPIPGPVVADSRQVMPGSLFVALPGERVDGADFARGAVSDGAVLVLAEREIDGLPTLVVPDARLALGDLAREVLRRHRARYEGVKVFGITGSNGKTTTKDLLGTLLAGDNPETTIAPRGSYNSDIGLPITVLRATDATYNFVMEFGADKPGDNTYLSSIIEPQYVIVLKVGTAHIEAFGSQEAIADAKFECVSHMTAGTVILNADDHRVIGLRPRAEAAGHRVVTFGLNRGAELPAPDVSADKVTLDAAGRASFQLHARGQSVPVHLRLVGEHHVYNALAAATAALEAGLLLETVASRLAADPASPHRMAVTQRPDGITVIDDAYNANPESMIAALHALVAMAGEERRSVAVLGEMFELGDRSKSDHGYVGATAAGLGVDLLITVGEGAEMIHHAARYAREKGDETEPVLAADLEDARAVLRKRLAPGDVVLVKASNGTELWRLGDELADGSLGAVGGDNE